MVINYETEIEILLKDQEKIVTYKQLSNRYNLTPNEAKETLSKFIENKRKDAKTDKFYVTFLIIGEDKETKVKKVNLVNESDLKIIEKDMKILSKQIFSIQNYKIDDFNLFYSSDIDASNNIERIVCGEKNAKNMLDSIQTNTSSTKIEPDIAKLNINKQSNTSTKSATEPVKPLNQSNAKNDSHQKENIQDIKDSKVKNEPIEEENTETLSKKAKFNSENVKEKEASKQANNKSSLKKAEPSKATGKQATLTSFFKKA